MGAKHDFTPHYFTLRWLRLANGHLEIAHHDPDVEIGDRILWGPNREEAFTYEVVNVSRQADLADQWIAELRQVKPEIYVAGERITHEQKRTNQVFTNNLPKQFLK